MEPFDLKEQDAILHVLRDPLYASAFKKFFRNHEVYYTERARVELNIIPEDLHAKAKHEAQAKQYAAMAKAWGTAYAELEKVAEA